MQLTIHRGTHEIGGNCVELATESTRIVVDVGMPLVDANGESFDSQSLKGKSVSQLLDDGTLPNVPGLFGEGPSPDGVLLSHAHSDHTGLLKYTKREIPVHLSHGTSDMMYVGFKFAGQAGVGRDRQRKFKSGEPFRIGNFKITAHAVDHSAFDSMAFIIEAEGKRILYSGDLRRHGRKAYMANNLITAATEKPIDLMLMEGTHATPSRKPPVTEEQLEERIIPRIEESKGIVLTCFSPLHVDRLVTFFKATGKAGRTFVIDPYAALVMNKASNYCKVPDPVKTRTIKVYYYKYFEESYQRKQLGYIYKMFEANRIDVGELRERPEDFVMLFRPGMIDPDFDGTLPQHARCIYSYWSGYLKKPEWVRLQEKLKAADGEFIKEHTSGHIFADDLVDFVEAIQPKRIVPIHTGEPAVFQDYFDNVVELEDGQPLTI